MNRSNTNYELVPKFWVAQATRFYCTIADPENDAEGVFFRVIH